MAASATTVANPTVNRRPRGPRSAHRPAAAPLMATATVHAPTTATATTNNRRRKRRPAGRSLIGEAISDAVHRQQVAGPVGVGLELPADVLDVRVDGPFVGL